MLNTSALVLLSVVALGGRIPSDAPTPQRAHTPPVELWTDGTGGEGVFRAADRVRVFLRTAFNAYATVFRIDTDGRIEILMPGTPWRNNWVRAGREYEIRPGPERYTFLVDDYPGQGYLLAVASRAPFHYRAFVAGEAWDLRAVGQDGWITGDPYDALMRLIDAIVPGGAADYVYDVLPYDVGEAHEYPRFLCYDCHTHAAYPSWNPYDHTCTRVRLVIYNDPYYYPARAARGMRVVFTRPSRLEPRFVFEHGGTDHPYIERVHRRPGHDTGARRRGAEEEGVARHPDPLPSLLERR